MYNCTSGWRGQLVTHNGGIDKAGGTDPVAGGTDLVPPIPLWESVGGININAPVAPIFSRGTERGLARSVSSSCGITAGGVANE